MYVLVADASTRRSRAGRYLFSVGYFFIIIIFSPITTTRMYVSYS